MPRKKKQLKPEIGMPRKKIKNYNPKEWVRNGFCRVCCKAIESRFNGRSVRHVEGTDYCLPLLRKTDYSVDGWSTTEDTSRVQDEVVSPEEEDF